MRTGGLGVAVAAAVVGAVGAGLMIGGDADRAEGAAALTGFRNCADLSSHARAQALASDRLQGRLWSGGAVRASSPEVTLEAADAASGAMPPGPDAFSDTNVQEQGVGEPDQVVTDGAVAFMARGNGTVTAVRVGETPQTLGSLRIGAPWSTASMLLVGERLVVITEGPVALPLADGPVAATEAMPVEPFGEDTRLTLIDVSEPSQMRVIERMDIEGRLVAARGIGGTVRLVVHTSPNPPAAAFPEVGPAAGTAELRRAERTYAARSREAIERAPTDAWVPTYRLERMNGGGETRRLVPCGSISRPRSDAGPGVLSLLTIDPAQGLDPVDRDGVMTAGQTVYASPDAVYVATTDWSPRPDAPATTEIHRFALTGPRSADYAGSGSVRGELLSQWSMSQLDGVLRVASTEPERWNARGTRSVRPSASRVTALRVTGDGLREIGGVEGLGVTERIFAVRFMGETGYVVTFRQTDPLYVVDLSDPTAPAVRGELKIPGYSAYLHPVGEGRLLGVGQNATATGRTTGTQVSLFDVSDPSDPARLDTVEMRGGWSEVEGNHHAFLYWAPASTAVVPVSVNLPGDTLTGQSWTGEARVLRIEGDTLRTAGALRHPGGFEGTITRSMVSGDTLLTFSDRGVQANDLESLDRTGWAGFPRR